MSYIDSSTSRLDSVADEPEPLDTPEEEAEEEQRPRRRPRGSLKSNLVAQIKDINLARRLDWQELDEIGAAVILEYNLDVESRDEWATKASSALRYATQESQPKEYPWPGASAVMYPLISKAAIEFGSRAFAAVIPGRNVVRGIVWGDDNGEPVLDAQGQPKLQPPAAPGQPPQIQWIVQPGERRRRADLIGEHMSWQLLDEMKEWQPQTDTLLHQIPVVGGAARKTFFEPAEKRNYSLFVSLLSLVWDYRAESFETAPRHSEILRKYPHEIIEFENTGLTGDEEDGMWLHYDYGPATGGTVAADTEQEQEREESNSADPDGRHIFIEQHRRWDLDGDGYAEPYVVTVHYRSSKVVRIVARYDEDGIHTTPRGAIQRIEPIDHYTLIPFLPSIDGGSYPMGFGHLLRQLNEAINSTLNQMFDAGHLANSNSGFIDDGLSIPSGDMRFQVGRYIRARTRGHSLRDSVLPLPFQGPSQVLFSLLGVLIEKSEGLASIQNILTGDAAIANAPPTTILALIEQGMRVHNAIHKRVFLALGQEFAKLYNLNRRHLTEVIQFERGDKTFKVGPDDYKMGGGVEPVADPSMTTDMQKMGRSQLLLGMQKDHPAVLSEQKVVERVLTNAGIDRIPDLMIPPDPTMAQMAMAKAQAELGRERAAEQKDLTQAYLNMALARKAADAKEIEWMNVQLDAMRYHIEALNTTIKAAAVDHSFHRTNLEHTRAMAEAAADGETSAPVPPAAPTPAPPGFPAPSGEPTPGPTPPAPKTDAAANASLPPLPPPGSSPLEGAPGFATPKPSALGAP